MSGQASCSYSSHKLWIGPSRDTQELADGDKTRHDADSHVDVPTATVSQIGEDDVVVRLDASVKDQS